MGLFKANNSSFTCSDFTFQTGSAERRLGYVDPVYETVDTSKVDELIAYYALSSTTTDELNSEYTRVTEIGKPLFGKWRARFVTI